MSKAKVNRQMVVCLTNIPSPYRLHFFHALSSELEKQGRELEVWFMAKSERGRFWQFGPGAFKFRHRFLRGISFDIASAVIHFNPTVLPLLLKESPDVLLVAGAWLHPTNILAVLGSMIRGHSRLLFWSESHLQSIRRKGLWVDKSRALLLRWYDGFTVPGKLARDYVQHYAPDKPMYVLPNIVDERVFRDRVLQYRAIKNRLREEFKITKQKRVLLLPARLISEKGILPFLSAISSLPSAVTGEFTLVIAGDGPLREQITLWANQHAEIDIRLLGYVEESEMVRLYAMADAFVLPSLSDPNPLAVIEALWAGLPLLLSDRVGNRYEALRVGENGLLFNPESRDNTRETLEKWVTLSAEELEIYGKASAKIAHERFKTETVVKNLLNQILN